MASALSAHRPLRLASGHFSPGMLLRLCRGYASHPAAASLGGEGGPERTYELVDRTGSHEVWAIHWPAGARLDYHDHGGSAGALTVVRGCLVEGTPDGGGVRRRRLPAGSGTAFGPSHVHDVVNEAVAPATSIHAYSPPLAAMTYFDLDRAELVARGTEHLAEPAGAR